MGSFTPFERVLAALGSLAAIAAFILAVWLALAGSRPKEATQASPSPTPVPPTIIIQSAASPSVENPPPVIIYRSSEVVTSAPSVPRTRERVNAPTPEVKPQLEASTETLRAPVAPLAKTSLSPASSALLFVAELGDHEGVKRWLANGADPNAISVDGKTPLMLAATNGHHDICQTLVLAGALTSAIDQRRRNALHYAAEGGHNDVVKYLLDHGAPVEEIDVDGNTPLLLAERGGHETSAKVIRRIVLNIR